MRKPASCICSALHQPVPVSVPQPVSTSRKELTHEVLPDGVYDVFLTMPAGEEAQLYERLRAGLQQKLVEEFGITGRPEKREISVYVLIAPDGRPSSLRDPLSSKRASVTGGQFRNMGTVALAGKLEHVLHQPVVDETGLTGRYDFDFTCDTRDLGSVTQALQEQLGLSMRPAERSVKVLVVE